MRKFLSKLPVKSKLILFALSSAILFVMFLYLQNWPTLTAEATLHRMERQHLAPRGEVVARGRIDPPASIKGNGVGDVWMVTQSADGEYAVAVIERLWGILWQSAEYHRPAQYPQVNQGLFSVSAALDFIASPIDHTQGYFHTCLVFSQDSAVTRVTVTEAALPLKAQSDPAPYVEMHGTTADCTQIIPGVWLSEQFFPTAALTPGGSSSAPWTILRGYDAEGNLLYEYLPKPRGKE